MAAPEIMAYARGVAGAEREDAAGFVYVSASHNPRGHNGLKFGLGDGGVLGAADSAASSNPIAPSSPTPSLRRASCR